MAYTRPAASAADATFSGATAYTRPSASAADATFPQASFEAAITAAVHITAGANAAHGVGATGAASIPVTASIAASHGVAANAAAVVAIAGAADLEFTQPGITATLTASVPLAASIDAAHGVAASATALVAITGAAAVVHGAAASMAATVPIAAGAAAAHGVAATGTASVGLRASITALIARYELIGEVRMGGVLVNRRVRAYRRSDGAFAGEVDTVAGRFRVHAGFASGVEHYVVPIDLSDTATDWAPPVANRVMPSLALDA